MSYYVNHKLKTKLMHCTQLMNKQNRNTNIIVLR